MLAADVNAPSITLTQQAREAASSDCLSTMRPPRTLSYRSIADIEDWLSVVVTRLRSLQGDPTRAEEWILDNDYQIRRAARQIQHDLPSGFYAQLPGLSEREDELSTATEPRVNAVARKLLLASGADFNEAHTVEFINAYQTIAPLNLSELWALPSFFRLISIEIIVQGLCAVLDDLPSPFQGAGASHLLSSNATERVALGVTFLIATDGFDWKAFLDNTSLVEQTLLQDPSGVYKRMDFDTRNRYREAVETTARYCAASEIRVAEHVLSLADQHSDDKRKGHVGYWLIAEGTEVLESVLDVRLGVRERFRRWVQRRAIGLYAGGVTVFTLLALVLPMVYLSASGAHWSVWLLVLMLTIIPATVLAITSLHWLITSILPPRALPEFDFSEGIPTSCASVVVVPVIIAHHEAVPALLRQLEIRYLANRQGNLKFVLLSDLSDAAWESLPEDEYIERALIDGIRLLNQRYASDTGGSFILLHRKRQFNPSENCWMGWERKRGKIEQFNALLVDQDARAFALTEGEVAGLAGTRYVITLDADTQLPPGTAARLVGVVAHPLNRVVMIPGTDQPIAGYSIIQPRVQTLQDSGAQTRFSRAYAGETAIDIYSQLVSDVYSDLFGTGLYIGKGVYDVKAFRASLTGVVPTNTILSHDLFEGLHARVGLASNIVLYESLPDNYPEYSSRQHRWIRGDWQLLPWLQHRVVNALDDRVHNPLSRIDRFMIIDNLRRSLIAPALLLFLVGGWFALPGSAWVWTALALATFGTVAFRDIATGMLNTIRRRESIGLLHRVGDHAGRWFLTLVFLVNDAWVSIDAISRTLWRLRISRRHLLAWRSAAQARHQMSASGGVRQHWHTCWHSSAFALCIAVTLHWHDRAALAVASPILVLWVATPFVSLWLSGKRRTQRESLSTRDNDYLRRLARKTWHFFDTFVGPGDHWLPADNYQESPNGVIAHRTSPTNIGLYLVSTVGAHDLGFIGTAELLVRLSNTLNTVETLESSHGHVLNWYDTRTLEPLQPRYVSSVDSGNLAVSLLVLRHGSVDVANGPVINPYQNQGLLVLLSLLHESASSLERIQQPQLDNAVAVIQRRIAVASTLEGNWYGEFKTLVQSDWPTLEAVIADAVSTTAHINEGLVGELLSWLERFGHQLHTIERDLKEYMPWHMMMDTVPEELLSWVLTVNDQLSPAKPMQHQCGLRQTIYAQLKAQAMNRVDSDPLMQWLSLYQSTLSNGLDRQQQLMDRLRSTAQRAVNLAYRMDFRWLYSPRRRLLHIGYDVRAARMDDNYYDLLASEARLASFFAIAKGDIPLDHWYALRRPIGRISKTPTLLSWNGSMFEYLMPSLFLPGKRDSLLGESESSAVRQQQYYARRRGVPWGISESAYGVTDGEGTYQYRAFGIPELGLRRGLTEDLVVAPYASVLALCVWPESAVKNLRQMDTLDAEGRYGFIDALDFTPDRLPSRRTHRAVRTYMAHHQGMSIIAIVNAVRSDCMVRRTLSEKSMAAIELLLQEGVPWDAPRERGRFDEPIPATQSILTSAPLVPWVPWPEADFRQIHLLGNGQFGSRQSDTGGGGLVFRGWAMTRWIPDSARELFGLFAYVRDVTHNRSWRVGDSHISTHQGELNVVFHPHMLELVQQHHGLTVRLEVVVAPDDPLEVRRFAIANDHDKPVVIELTSFAEIALASPEDDERHPAFSKLFVHSRFLPQERGLLYTRRPRDPSSRPPVLMHQLVSDDTGIELVGYETDRARFLGRASPPGQPQALLTNLSDTTGWTLDPIMALRVRCTIAAGEQRQIVLQSVAGDSIADVMQTASRHKQFAADAVFIDAAKHVAREAAQSAVEASWLPQFQALGSLLLHPNSSFRVAPAISSSIPCNQQVLWQFGISGDVPLLLVRMTPGTSREYLERWVAAHAWWRTRCLKCDLVVLRYGSGGYEEPVRDMIMSVLHDRGAYECLGQRGGIHLLSADNLDSDRRQAIEAMAQVVLDDDIDQVEAKLNRLLMSSPVSSQFEPTGWTQAEPLEPVVKPTGLLFDTEFGGFDVSAREYVIQLEPGARTPAPWCNVLANEHFGSIVSESGLGFTWMTNSGENRLTSWSNDPVLDTLGEALYLRDEQSAEFWSVTPAPVGSDSACQVRHGLGYTSWLRRSQGLEQALCVLVPVADPVKLVRLRLTNRSPEARRITATYYAEWLLGSLASRARPQIQCRYDDECQAILCSNAWNPEFEHCTGFLSASQAPHSVTGNRRDFLGATGDLASPHGLLNWDLGNRFTVGDDPCGAYQVHVNLKPGESVEVLYCLGQATDEEAARSLLMRCRSFEYFDIEQASINNFWRHTGEALQVTTPDPAFDVMINQWLVYQSISSRLMARAGFYQAGGAYGFRDQLQDVLAIIPSNPELVREHIMRAARHQFEQGDVLHWWHPPAGRGVRTRCSDDFLWLPFVVFRYVVATGDYTVLDEQVPLLTAPELELDEHDRYTLYEETASISVFEHCVRAIERGRPVGEHGLPLMGGGDWNDGMDRIGAGGAGESTWLAWFQMATIKGFTPLAENRGETELAASWDERCRQLDQAIDQHAWDGEWYVRAFDDEGIPWGSASNEECQIDAIAQAWSVLASASNIGRSRTALRSATKRLVDAEHRIVKLLDPPFDKTSRDPGYIKAYPPGVRENGGQYTHGAAWLGIALAEAGEVDMAYRVFDFINPIRRTCDAQSSLRYAREPYVLAGDIAGPGDCAGRGGWTWYTGAASWTWQLGVHSMLGIHFEGNAIRLAPRLPTHWDEVSVIVKRGKSSLFIRIHNRPGCTCRKPCALGEIVVDGVVLSGDLIEFPHTDTVREVLIHPSNVGITPRV